MYHVLPRRKTMKEGDFKRVIPIYLKHLRARESEILQSQSSDETTTSGRNQDSPSSSLDPLPPDVLERYGLMPWLQALEVVHAGLGQEFQPADRTAARRRFVFQELLFLSLMLLNKRITSCSSTASDPIICDRTVRCHPVFYETSTISTTFLRPWQ